MPEKEDSTNSPPSEKLSYLEYVRMIVERDPDPLRASMIALADVARATMPKASRVACRMHAEAALGYEQQRGKTPEEAYKTLSGRIFSLMVGLSELVPDPDDEREGGDS